TPPPNAGRANIEICEHVPQNVAAGDNSRIARLSDAAARLLNDYDLVIGTDADEFLVVDPRTGKSLAEYLSSIKIKGSVSALGMDVGQHRENEKPIDASQPFLSQRHYALVSTRYTKSSVISEPLRWGAGFHRVRGRNFRIDPNLYLFHFGCVDLAMCMAKFSDQDRMASGWEKHMRKRLRTIEMVSGRKVHKGEGWLKFARRLQRAVRLPYAWNKPAMFGWRLVVEIPERFSTTV
ncbi:glycosyltransferase family 2 protein, partial [Alistipes sp. OttesenSCG-928-B03]|nr:glycosyltransferase family 2 protein [Alistipes sp. OttesenSCG-928-B03]